MDKDLIMTHLSTRIGISRLNAIQNAFIEKYETCKSNIVLYSPTGSGKTIAFAIPLLSSVDENVGAIQALIVVPSRELAIQTTDVLKILSSSIKITCCYGGHSSQDERFSLAAPPAIVVGTPGRLLDHIERGNINAKDVTMLVLDEFDKSLELGFVDDMKSIFKRLPSTLRTIMTSATVIKSVPDFIDILKYETVNFLKQKEFSPQNRITTWQVRYDNNNRLQCLIRLLLSLPDERTIIFANQRDTAQLIYRQLVKMGFTTGLFIGTLEQSEREKVLSMLKNGSLLVIVSTDLGGRGIDISDIKHIIHYEQPLTIEIFTHRNGRTARIDATGNVYVITGQGETVAPFITIDGQYQNESSSAQMLKCPTHATIHISAGKKEKISRGDVLGYLLHNCPMLSANEITGIDIYDHYTLIGAPKEKAENIVKTISPFKLKKQKVKSMVVGFRAKFVK